MNKIKDKIDLIKYISLKDASKLCSYSQDYLSLRARQGKLKAVKSGRNWVTTKDWLNEYINRANDYAKQVSNKKSVSKKIKKESIWKKIPDLESLTEIALIKTKKDLLKLEDIAEKYIGDSIDRILSSYDKFILITKQVIRDVYSQLSLYKKSKSHIKPKFIISAILIFLVIISSLLLFNPQVWASMANFAHKSIDKIADSGREVAEFVFTTGQNVSLLTQDTKQSASDLFDSIVVKSPKLIEESTKSIKEVSSKTNSDIQNKFINLSKKTSIVIQSIPNLIKGYYKNIDNFVTTINKTPKKIFEFAINVNQKNENLKLAIRHDSVIIFNEIRFEIKNISKQIIQIPSQFGKLSNKAIYAFIDISEKNENAKLLFLDKIKNTKNILSDMPYYISLKINRIASNFSNTYANVLNILSDIPNILSDTSINVGNKIISSYKQISLYLHNSGENISIFAKNSVKNLSNIAKQTPKDILAGFFGIISEFNNKLTDKITSTPDKIFNISDNIKSKLGDTYIKIAEFVIPGYSFYDQENYLVYQNKQETTIKELPIIQEITKQVQQKTVTQKITITETIELKDIARINQDIENLSNRITSLGNQIGSKIDYTVPSYAPIYIPSSGLQVSGHALLSSFNVTGSGAIAGSLGVAGNASFGNTKNQTTVFDVYSDSTFHNGVSFNSGLSATSLSSTGNTTITGTLTAATTTLSQLTINNDLLVSGNATTTGSHYISKDLTVTGAFNQSGASASFATTTIVGDFTVQNLDGVSNFYVQNNTGNVGIGTTTPLASMSIQGSGNNVMALANSSGGNLVTVQNNGNVGIGTTTPDSALTVIGKIHASSTSEQLRLTYDLESSKYASFTIDSNGDLTIDLATANSTTTISNNLSVLGYLNTEGNSTTTGSFYINKDLTIDGESTLGNNLNITGYATTTAGLFTLGEIRVAGNITSDSNLLINGNATTTGSLNVDGDFLTDGTGSFANTALTIDSLGNLTTTGYASTTTYLNTQGDSHIGGSLSVDGTTTLLGDITQTGNLNITGYASTTAGLFTLGEIRTASNLTSDGNLLVNGNATTTGSLNVDGDFLTDGTGSFASANLTIDSSGNLITTGYASTTQGLYTQSNIHSGGTFSTDGTATFNNIITQTGTGQVIFTGNVNATNGLDVTTANLTVGGSNFIVDQSNGNMTTLGYASSTAGLFTLGEIRTASNLTSDGNLLVNGNATTTGSLNVDGDFLTDGTGSFASANLTIDSSGNLITTGYASTTQGLYTQSNIHSGGTFSTDGTATFNNIITQTGTGQVTFTGNVNATNGLDVTTANLTVGGSNFIVDQSNGNITTLGYATTTGLFTQGNIHVGGNATVDGTLTLLGDITQTGNLNITGYASTTAGLFTLANSHIGGNLTVDGSTTILGTTSFSGNLDMNDNLILNIGNSGTDFTTGGGLTLAGSATTTGYMSAGTDDGYFNFTAGDLNASGELRIGEGATFNGNVGIGTTGPVNKLHVFVDNSATTIGEGRIGNAEIENDNNGAGTFAALALRSGAFDSAITAVYSGSGETGRLAFHVDKGAELLEALSIVHTTGNVGIGTTAPTALLHVQRGSGGTDPLFQVGTSTSAGMFTVKSNGNVGIGTTTPKANLVVNGTTNNFLQVASSTNQGIFVINNNGNIGIGTTSPTSLLHLNETPANEPTTPTLSFGDGDTGIYEHTDDQLDISAGGTQAWVFSATSLNAGGGGGVNLQKSWATASDVMVRPYAVDSDTGIGRAGDNILSLIAGGTSALNVNTGNVGIGTTAPGAKLELGSGQFSLPAGTVGVPSLAFTTELDTGIFQTGTANMPALVSDGVAIAGWRNDVATGFTLNSTMPLGWSSGDPGSQGPDVILSRGAANKLYLASGDDFIVVSGNVGIGTTGPGEQLTLGNSAETEKGIKFQDNDAPDSQYANIIYGSGDNLLKLSNAGNLGMVIKSDGNVGIGTTGPVSPLNVYNNASGIFTATLKNDQSSAGDVLNIISDGTGSGSHMLKIQTGTYNPIVDITGTIVGLENLAVGTAYIHTIPPANGAIIAGNVGIGTTTPIAKLSVKGTGTGTGRLMQLTDSNNVEKVTILDNGNVGIGTAVPLGKLGISVPNDGSINPMLAFRLTDYPTYGFDFHMDAPATGNLWLNRVEGGVSSAVMAFVRSTGNVGIGITAPTALLHVQRGSGGTDPLFQVGTSTSAGMFVIKSDGNVGIGTTNPATALDVWGKIRAENGNGYYAELYDNGLNLTRASSNYIDIPSDSGNFSIRTGSGYANRLRMHPGGGLAIGDSFYSTNPGTDNVIIEGNVGIGTTTPIAKLSVKGTGTGTGRLLQLTDSDNTEKVTVLDNGNVGIGTTTPSGKLAISSGTSGAGANVNADELVIEGSGNTGMNILSPNTAHQYVNFGDPENSGSGMIEYYHVDNHMAFRTTGSEKVRITTDGNVGIGTTGPSGLLHLYGTAAANQPMYNEHVNTVGAPYYQFRMARTGNTSVQNSDWLGLLGFQGYDGTAYRDAAYILAGVEGVTGTNDIPSYIAFATSPDGSATGVERVRITNQGNVGIGTASPGANLHIVNSAGTTELRLSTASYINRVYSDAYDNLIISADDSAQGADSYLGFKVDGSEVMRAMNGNVGIGTTEPGAELEVHSTADGYFTYSDQGIDIYNPESITGNPLRIGSAYDTPGIYRNGDIYIRTVSSNILLNPIGGNVGIGDTSPDAKFEILKTTGNENAIFMVSSTTDGDLLTIKNTGNVGIGTTEPSRQLHLYKATGQADQLIESDDSNVALLLDAGTGDNSVLSFREAGGQSAEIGTIGSDNSFRIAMGGLGTADKVTILTDGNVGIGTTSPQTNLHISSSIAREAGVEIESTNATGYPFLRFYDANEDYSWAVGLDDTNNKFSIGYNTGRITGADTGAKMVITNAGKVGIGTTGPSEKLQVSGSAHKIELSDSGDSDNPRVQLSHADGSGGHFSLYDDSEVEQVHIRSYGVSHFNGGNVGIGTMSPSYKLHVLSTAADNSVYIHNSNSSGYGPYLRGGSGTRYALAVASYDNTSLLMVLGNGNVGIGTTNPSSNTLQVTGSAGKTVGGTSWSDLSDVRLKNVLAEISGTALDTISLLRPIKYEWNSLHEQLYGTSTDSVMYGFVAQELAEVIPEMVKEGGDGYYWYNPSGFEAILTAGIQEITSRINLTNAPTSTSSLIIDQQGRFGIATTTPTNIFTIGQGRGNAIADGWDVYSSKEYKTDITYLEEQDYEDILDEIEALNTATYVWKEDPSMETNFGVIAEEAPDRVLAKDGKSVSLYDYATFAIAGVKAVKSEVDKMKDLLGITKNEDGTLSMIEEKIVSQGTSLSGLVIDDEGYAVIDKIKSKLIETENLKIKAEDAMQSGITIYDTKTGSPYCLYTEYGVPMTKSGECSTVLEGIEPVVESAPTTPEITPEPEPEPIIISGCTDSSADNYNSEATEDDNSCIYPTPEPEPASSAGEETSTSTEEVL